MSDFPKTSLPTSNALKCTMCHEQNVVAKGHRTGTVQAKGEQVPADIFEIHCRDCPNHALVAFRSSEATSSADYHEWNSNPRDFLGFLSRGQNDPTGRGGGKFINLNGEKIPTVRRV